MQTPIALSDAQMHELKSTAATLPVDRRGDLLKLVAGFMQVEGDLASADAFTRALTFALDQLHPPNKRRGVG
jgi:hypothetical protein